MRPVGRAQAAQALYHTLRELGEEALACDEGLGAHGEGHAGPARRVFIPNPGSSERRPLSIPPVRDQIVQAATKIVIEPIFEADFLSCSFGFRPGRSQHDARQVLIDEAWDGRRWVAESDVSDCFGAIPHSGVMSAIEERMSDRHLLKLLRAMLRSGVMEDGAVRREVTGTPQGGVISPCLCNVYLHRFDRQWAQRGHGVLVRFADDLIAMCETRAEAQAARLSLRQILGELGLELKDAKRKIVHLEKGGEGVDFLGFHHRWVRANRARHVEFLARWPSRRAMQHARERVRELTARDRLRWPIEQVAQDLNRFLRRWAGYFRYGNSTVQFDRIVRHAERRLQLWIANSHQQPWAHGGSGSTPGRAATD